MNFTLLSSFLGVYEKYIDIVAHHIKPEIKKYLTREGAEFVSITLIATCEAKSGNPLAQLFIENTAEVAKRQINLILQKLSCPIPDENPMAYQWLTHHFEILCDFFLDKNIGGRFNAKGNSLFGSGVSSVFTEEELEKFRKELP